MNRKHLAIFLCFFSTIAVAMTPQSMMYANPWAKDQWKGEFVKDAVGQYAPMPKNASFAEMVIYGTKKASYVGSLLGIINSVEKGIQGVLDGGMKRLPSVTALINRLLSKVANNLCNRPNPLTASDVQIWEQMVDGVTNALCEQSSSGNLMLRNIRVGEEDQEQATDINWSYFIEMIDSMFGHVNDCLRGRLPYYEGGHEQTQWLVSTIDSFSTMDKAGIAFMIKTIVSNLRHISLVCKKAESIDELDKSHVKKIARTTLLLFRKLRVMLDGESKKGGANTVPSLPQSYPGMSGSGGMLNY